MHWQGLLFTFPPLKIHTLEIAPFALESFAYRPPVVPLNYLKFGKFFTDCKQILGLCNEDVAADSTLCIHHFT